MNFHKKETEKIELVAKPELYKALGVTQYRLAQTPARPGQLRAGRPALVRGPLGQQSRQPSILRPQPPIRPAIPRYSNWRKAK